MFRQHTRLSFIQKRLSRLLPCLILGSGLQQNLTFAVQSVPSVQTGPAIGDKIPTFRTIDQNGETQDFQSIRGPAGALILFFRSADW